MSLTRTRRLVAFLVTATLIAIPSISCAAEQAPPEEPPTAVAPDKIVIPVAVDLSGPYAMQNQMVINGLTDCLGYVNETGGIKGVPLEFLIRDTEGAPDNAVTILTEFMSMDPKPALVSFLDTQVGVALKDRFAEEQVVNIMGIGSTPALYPAANTFAISTENGDQFGLFCDWLVEREAPNQPKVAILTWDNVFGNVVLEQRCLDYAESVGVDLVATEVFNLTDVDVSAQLQRIKNAGAEWIYTNTLLIGPGVIAKTANALEMGDDFQFAVAGVAANYITMQLSGGMEGWIAPSPWVSWDETDIEGVQVMDEQFQKNERTSTDRQNVYVGAFIAALLMQQTFNKVVDDFGWDGLTGPNVKEVLQNTKDFEAMGLTKISFSEEMRHGLYCKMYEMTEGKILPISDWMEVPHLE